MNKSQKQILDVLDYLKELGVPCNVTMYYQDFIHHIDLNKNPSKLVMDITTETRQYHLMIMVGGKHRFSIHNNTISSNQQHIENLNWVIKNEYSEYVTNENRKKKLKDILSDPNPQPLI